MRYQKQLDKVISGTMSRFGLVHLKQNAENLVQKGGKGAIAILEAINDAHPSEPYYVFMGFCPDSDFDNRLDIEWREKHITFLMIPQLMCEIEKSILKNPEQGVESPQ